MDLIFNIIITPLCLMFEFLFDNIYKFNQNIILTIFLISFIVCLICLPLQLKAQKIQKEEEKIQKKLSKRINSIRKNFKGDERFFLLQTYYRQNNYNPIMALRTSLNLLLQIPIFISAYIFFSNLEILNNAHCLFINNLLKPDNLLIIGNLKINLLPILMTIINLVAGLIYANNKKEKINIIIIALIFLILLYNSPSALVIYWTFNNVFSLIKNIILNFINLENKNNTQKKDNYKKLFFINLTALWILLGFYIPSNILATSPYEFIFYDATPKEILLYSILVHFGIFIFWGSIIYYFSNSSIKKFLSLFLTLFLFISLFNLSAFRLPNSILTNTFAFNSARIDFCSYNKIYIFICIFIMLLIAFFTIKAFLKQKLKPIYLIIISILSTCIIISSVNIIKISTKLNQYQKTTKNSKEKLEKYIKLSKTNKNILIIFADRAISSYLPIIFSEQPKLYKQFSGFTYYPNTLSYAQYTLLGYPAILGGYEYTPINLNKTNIPFEKKFSQAITMLPAIFSLNKWNSTVINPINEGWESETWGGVVQREIDILAQSALYNKFNVKNFNVPQTISEELKTKVNLANGKISKRNLIFYSLLSIFPINFRETLYDDGLYHNPNNNVHNYYSEEFIQAYSELYFLSDITDFSSKKNNFIVFNSSLTHNPSYLKYPNYDLSNFHDTNYKPKIDERINSWSMKHYHTNTAFLKLIGDYFDYLRENNVYDNTRIIIVSDHGIGYGLQNPYLSNFEMENFMPYNALLLVKDFNQNDKIKISENFMTNADTPIIATKDIIKNPINPFSKKTLSNKEKENGVIIKTDTKWQPVYYLNKTKILNKKDNFSYVNKNPYNKDNWRINLKFSDVIKYK